MVESGGSCKDGWGQDLFVYDRMPKLGRGSDINTGSPCKCELTESHRRRSHAGEDMKTKGEESFLITASKNGPQCFKIAESFL